MKTNSPWDNAETTTLTSCTKTPRCATCRPTSRSRQPTRFSAAHAGVRSARKPVPSSSSVPQAPSRSCPSSPQARALGALACPSDGPSAQHPQVSRARQASRLAIARPRAPRWRVSSAREGLSEPPVARKS
ncbi:hypothetical protein K523DRAFT_247610 [Schizophyllum commune Tattone D]|nr:hypothetical protein K523DRAFT_247610 [Schizophyllum commune Tattone D]